MLIQSHVASAEYFSIYFFNDQLVSFLKELPAGEFDNFWIFQTIEMG